MSKVWIIGLDGGTFKIIDYLIGQKQMPSFSRFISDGSRAILKSTMPPITPAAWSSFYTGSNPGKTGIVDFYKWVPGTYKLSPINSGDVGCQPIWIQASNAGKRVCTYNVPVTYPAAPVNGILISGMDAPSFDDFCVFPKDFKEELLLNISDFSVNPDIDIFYLANNHPDPVGEYARRMNSFLQTELKTIRFLADKEDWDLFVSVIRSTDILQHIFMKQVDNVIDGNGSSTEDEARRAEFVFSCYKQIDALLGEFCSKLEEIDGQLIIMSDHGFTTLRKQVNLNRMLADAGLLKFNSASKLRTMTNTLKKSVSARIPKKTRASLKKYLRMEDEIFWMKKHADSMTDYIDWSQTHTCVIGQFGCLYVNMKDRQPLGLIADEKERRAVLDKVKESLSKLVDPDDNKPVVADFFHREDIYAGPLIEQLPDMVIQMRNTYQGVFAPDENSQTEIVTAPKNKYVKDLCHTGTHTGDGILILYGSNFRHVDFKLANMVDIAPTVMNVLGLPFFGESDGNILTSSFVNGTAKTVDESLTAEKTKNFKYKTEKKKYSDDEEEEIRKRLENLGYL